MKILHPAAHQHFCKIVSGEVESFKIAMNDCFIAILDTDPVTRGHTLLIPKRPILEWREMTEDEVLSLHCFIKDMSAGLMQRLSAHGISIVQNGGECNSISYFHVHLIPRFDTVSIWKEELKDETTLSEVFALLKSELTTEDRLYRG